MADIFLNSEATLQSRINIKLNFSADLDELYQQPKIGYRSKNFTIDPDTIYDITYVDRSPHHKTEMITVTGKVIAVSYTPNRSDFVHPIIYNSVAKNIGESEETAFKPTDIKIDASTEYSRDVRIVDISDIRNIDLHDMGIDLSTYKPGDILCIKCMNGRIYNTAVVKEILACDPEGEILIVDELIPDEEKSDLTGEPIETAEFRKTIIKKDIISSIELKRAAPKFDYNNGDTVEISTSDGSNGYIAYPGIIMDIITHKMKDDEEGLYTFDNVVGVVLKYREGMPGNTTKEITRFFYMEEIVRILPFTFPWSDPDVTTVIDEGYSRGDDPDDIEADMYPTAYEVNTDEEDPNEGDPEDPIVDNPDDLDPAIDDPDQNDPNQTDPDPNDLDPTTDTDQNQNP